MLRVFSVKRRHNYHLHIIYDDHVLYKSSYELPQFSRVTRMSRFAIFADCLWLVLASQVCFQFPIIGGLGTGNRGILSWEIVYMGLGRLTDRKRAGGAKHRRCGAGWRVSRAGWGLLTIYYAAYISTLKLHQLLVSNMAKVFSLWLVGLIGGPTCYIVLKWEFNSHTCIKPDHASITIHQLSPFSRVAPPLLSVELWAPPFAVAMTEFGAITSL